MLFLALSLVQLLRINVIPSILVENWQYYRMPIMPFLSVISFSQTELSVVLIAVRQWPSYPTSGRR